MGKYTGVVKENQLEGGFWQLACDDGRVFTLANPEAGLQRNGLRVEVVGDIDEGATGIAMAGPLLVVRSYRAV